MTEGVITLDMHTNRRNYWRTAAPAVVSILVLVAIGFGVHSDATFTILNVIAINIVFALSYNMQLGQGGLLSFGHAVLMGAGGYAAVHLMNAIGGSSGWVTYIPIDVVPFVGFVGGGVVAFVIGRPFCRHGGLAYAMITLGLGALVPAAAQLFPSIFGGDSGILSDRVVGPAWFGQLTHAYDVYWFMVFWVVVATAGMWAFGRTPIGRLSNAMRDNPERLEFIGYSTRNVRFIVFVVSGAFAGLAGGMAAVNYEIVTTGMLGLEASGLVLLMAAVGGYGVFYGPILGAILVTIMNSLLSDYTQASLLYIGAVFLAIVMFAPQGLAGGVEGVRRAWRDGAILARAPRWAVGTCAVILETAGIITAVEALYQIRQGRDELAKMLGLTFDPHSALTWVAVVVLIAIGYTLQRLLKRDQGAG